MIRPFLMGAAMAVMMLWMLHRPIMAEDLNGAATALAFVAAHVVVLVFAFGILMFIPSLKAKVGRHRPSSRHVAVMLVGMVTSATVVHLVMHGLVV